MQELLGSLEYIAPEVIAGKYNEKCDLWSLGVILFVMLSGRPPYIGTEKEVKAKVKKGQIEFDPEVWKNVSEDAQDLLKKLLRRKVEERLSAAEAL